VVAVLGCVFSIIIHLWVQIIYTECMVVQVYALVGVAAMLAANCRVPLTSVLLLFELTRGTHGCMQCCKQQALPDMAPTFDSEQRY
jgi:H+/Cl- antiporter ClcA